MNYLDELKQVCVEPSSSALKMTLRAFAHERRHAARRRRSQLTIDISCPHGSQQQTHQTPLLL